MNDRALTIEQAIAQRNENPGARWPSRGSQSRLEPDCWPIIRPSFKISREARVFAIGSCFARSIEAHLLSLGFRVPALEISSDIERNPKRFGAELLNKYTPTAILQELLWVKLIFDRDDTVSDEDILPLLLEIDDGRYVDLHVTVNGAAGLPLEDHLVRRRLMYALGREAFLSDVAVVTLGLIETWWDRETGKTVELHPKLRNTSFHDRIVFRRLRFDEAYGATKSAVALLLEAPHRTILITTSPVPLNATFTRDDVVVANSFSKAMLRTVAGTIADETDRVDYFPSFESVMLTKRAEVWTDDLIHVQHAFVGLIMGRVVEQYSEGCTDTSVYLEKVRFEEAVRCQRWDMAKDLYARLATEARGPDVRHELLLAEFEVLNGRADESLRRIQALEEGYAEKFTWFEDLWCGRLYRLNGKEDDAVRLYTVAAEGARSNTITINAFISLFIRHKWHHELEWLLDWAAAAYSADFAFLTQLAAVWRTHGRVDRYHELTRASFRCGGEPEAVFRYVRDLETEGLREAAIDILANYTRQIRQPALLRKLSGLLLAEKRLSEAEAIISDWVDANANDADAHGFHAIVLAKTNRTPEATVAVRRSLDLGCTLPAVVKLSERLHG